MNNIHIPSNIDNLSQILEDGLILCNESGLIISSNDVARQFLNKKLNSRNIYEFIEIAEFKNLEESNQKNNLNEEFHFQTSDILKRSLIIKVKKIEDNLFAILLLDMTSQRNLEKVRRDFVANVSHELRSPLTSLVGFIETLLSGNVQDEETRNKFLKIMDEESKRMNRLIDDILSLSKVETEEHITPNTTISLIDPIKHIISSINEKRLKEDNKILIDDLRDDPEINCFISGNIDEINQVFVNLLENAIKYGFDNTNVIVRIEQLKNKEIRVSVINNGEGIPDKYIERLTERFFRVDKARSRKIGGTGLGLAIVKHILIKHRAQLSINSIPNQETNFSITFPIIN
jgi:two-component system phosphate regulon sensor histidine kinase PhoR